MATDISRIDAARAGIMAVTFPGKEANLVLSALDSLELAIVEARVKKREMAERKKVKPPEFLRCAADYQDAPHGTEVAKRFGSGWWRKVDDGWIDESCTVMPGSHIATAPREVLKWGDA